MAIYSESVTNSISLTGNHASQGLVSSIPNNTTVIKDNITVSVTLKSSISSSSTLTRNAGTFNRPLTSSIKTKNTAGRIISQSLTSSLPNNTIVSFSPSNSITVNQTIDAYATRMFKSTIPNNTVVSHNSLVNFNFTSSINVNQKLRPDLGAKSSFKYGLYSSRLDLPSNITIVYNSNVTFKYGATTVILPRPVLGNVEGSQLVQAKNRLRGNDIRNKTKFINNTLSLTFTNIKEGDIDSIKTFIQTTSLGKIIEYTSHEGFVYEGLITNPNTSIRNTRKSQDNEPKRYEFNISFLVISDNLKNISIKTFSGDQLVTLGNGDRIVRLKTYNV